MVGSSNTDLVIRMRRLPSSGETRLGDRFFTASGGKGANQAVAAARAGARVAFVSRVGGDDFGSTSIETLEKEEIDTRYVLTDPDLPSGVAFILVDEQGENTIVVAPGANAALSPTQLDAAAPQPSLPWREGIARCPEPLTWFSRQSQPPESVPASLLTVSSGFPIF